MGQTQVEQIVCVGAMAWRLEPGLKEGNVIEAYRKGKNAPVGFLGHPMQHLFSPTKMTQIYSKLLKAVTSIRIFEKTCQETGASILLTKLCINSILLPMRGTEFGSSSIKPCNTFVVNLFCFVENRNQRNCLIVLPLSAKHQH